MRIINAVWEERNLGVTCQEIEIERSDTKIDLQVAASKLEASYRIIKIPAGMTELIYTVQELGYKYVETNIQLVQKLTSKPVFKYEKMSPQISYHFANSDEEKDIVNQIKTGDIFSTDKVACDPEFSVGASGRRYAYWTEDVLRAGGKLVITEYCNQDIGFGVYIDRGKYYEAFLGGLLPGAKGSGLGQLSMFASTLGIYNCGAREIRTGVSSNNLPILRIHLDSGKYISKLTDIFVKHIR